MAKVPLRLYNREIENLIDHKQTDEATAHCRHILQIFPKHIDTYRLLGKAHLESQHYSEASDIFQRVISVIPDDFVSHVGLSIIREDEGNLDASIWHMERAFEVAPANAAVQEELRRLYTRRDGVEPPKVRLTRAALVRMYANGYLYDQAITEIHSALAEEPERADLQVMLARMFLANGQKIEATEICSKLLAKYPFCWAANQILAEILTGTAQAEDTQIYQQRLAAMDPYASFLSTLYSTPAEVPDSMVQVDRLEWDVSQGIGPDKPGWAETLGLKIDDSFPLDIPDWLNPNPPDKKTAAGVRGSPLPENIIPASMPPVDAPNVIPPALSEMGAKDAASEVPGETIPDWMKDSGWFSGDTNQSEIETGISEESAPGTPPDLSDIVPADIPDWVRSMAPVDSLPKTDLPEVKSVIPLPVEPVNERSETPLPDWLSNIIDRPEETPVSSVAGGSLTEVPDWLKNLEPSEPPQLIESPQDVVEKTPAEDVLSSAEISAKTEEHLEASLSGWLQEVEESAPIVPAANTTTEASVEENEIILPESETEAAGVVAMPAQEFQPAAEISLPSWMDSYEEEPLEDQPAVEIPTWLEGIPVEGIESEAEAASSLGTGWFDEAAAASDLARQVQTWEEVKPGLDQPVQQEELESAYSAVNADQAVLDQNVEEVTEVVEPVIPASEIELESEDAGAESPVPAELPEWLLAMQDEEQQSSAIAEEVSPVLEEVSAGIEPEEIPLPSQEAEPAISANVDVTPLPASSEQKPTAGDDSTLTWLEDLATTHSSEAKTLIIRKSNRNVQPPAWVHEEEPSAESTAEESVHPFPAAAAGSTQSENAALENWLKELEAEQQSKAPDAFVNKHEPVPKNTAALRMWLDNLLEETPEESPKAAPLQVIPAEDMAGQNDMDWLNESPASHTGEISTPDLEALIEGPLPTDELEELTETGVIPSAEVAVESIEAGPADILTPEAVDSAFGEIPAVELPAEVPSEESLSAIKAPAGLDMENGEIDEILPADVPQQGFEPELTVPETQESVEIEDVTPELTQITSDQAFEPEAMNLTEEEVSIEEAAGIEMALPEAITEELSSEPANEEFAPVVETPELETLPELMPLGETVSEAEMLEKPIDEVEPEPVVDSEMKIEAVSEEMPIGVSIESPEVSHAG